MNEKCEMYSSIMIDLYIQMYFFFSGMNYIHSFISRVELMIEKGVVYDDPVDFVIELSECLNSSAVLMEKYIIPMVKIAQTKARDGGSKVRKKHIRWLYSVANTLMQRNLFPEGWIYKNINPPAQPRGINSEDDHHTEEYGGTKRYQENIKVEQDFEECEPEYERKDQGLCKNTHGQFFKVSRSFDDKQFVPLRDRNNILQQNDQERQRKSNYKVSKSHEGRPEGCTGTSKDSRTCNVWVEIPQSMSQEDDQQLTFQQRSEDTKKIDQRSLISAIKSALHQTAQESKCCQIKQEKLYTLGNEKLKHSQTIAKYEPGTYYVSSEPHYKRSQTSSDGFANQLGTINKSHRKHQPKEVSQEASIKSKVTAFKGSDHEQKRKSDEMRRKRPMIDDKLSIKNDVKKQISPQVNKEVKKKELIEKIVHQVRTDVEKRRKKSVRSCNRQCWVPGCTVSMGYLKVHAFEQHVPKVFDERLDPKQENVLHIRKKALEQAARWLLGRPATLNELVTFLTIQKVMSLADNSSVTERQTEAMKSFCHFLGLEVPDEFRLCPINSPGSLLHYKALWLLSASLDEEEREYWKANFGSPIDIPSETIETLPVAFDAHLHLQRDQFSKD